MKQLALAVMLGVSLVGAPLSHAASATSSAKPAKQPLVITSDRMEMDDKRHITIFSGNVLVVEGDMRLAAERMTVTYKQKANKNSRGAEVQEVRAEGEVRLQDSTHQGVARAANYSVLRHSLELIGGPKEPASIQSQDQNRLEGEKIFIQLTPDRRIEKVVAEGGSGGRVKARISGSPDSPTKEEAVAPVGEGNTPTGGVSTPTESSKRGRKK